MMTWKKMWRPKFFSLQYKILILSLFLIVTPLLTVGTISYLKSSEIVQKKVSLTNLHTVQQIGINLELILQDIHNTSISLIQDQQIRSFFSLSPRLSDSYLRKQKLITEQYLVYLLSFKKYIDSIYIKGFNGLAIETQHSLYQISPAVEREALDLRGHHFWITTKITDYSGSTTNAISLVRVINDTAYINRRLAILQINIDEKRFASIYKDQTVSKHGYYLVFNQRNQIISALSKNILGKPIRTGLLNPERMNRKEGYYIGRSGRQDYLVTFYRIAEVGWTLVNIVPLAELLKENLIIQKVNFLVIIISFAVCAMMALLFSIKVLSPLRQLRVLMGNIETENFDGRIEIQGNDEITMLGRSFNKMSARLKELMNQVYITQIKQREAELKALQAQVNPHFLYNTLDTIYWSSRLENASETAKLVEALSKLFRLSLNSGDELTTVRKEVEHLKHYLTIQQKRYDGLVTFAIHIPAEEVLDCQVVKLVLQPLVENALYHGIEKKGRPGRINVLIERREAQLVYIVSDDGIGTDEAELNALLLQKEENNQRGFGIRNVNDRIQLYFGPEYGIKFYSQPGQGTKVVVTQPYTKEETTHA